MSMRAWRKRCSVLVVMIVAASAAYAQGTWELPPGAETFAFAPAPRPEGMVGPITFEETEFPDGTVVDGLVVTTLDGSPLPAPLTFGFSSADATIGDLGPGVTTYVEVPNMEGPTSGTLSIDFGLQATSATFGFVLQCGPPIVDGATAQALDANDNPVGSQVSIDALNFGSGWPENQLTVAPGGAFRAVEITFNSGSGCNRFAFDNLAYDGQPVPTLPAAGFAALVFLLVLGSTLAVSRRQA